MGPYLLAMLFLAIPSQVLSPPFERDGQARLEKNTPIQTINGIIREIQFIGPKRMFSEAAHPHINSRVGDPLDQRIVERDVRALANLGWFDFVTAEVIPIGDETDVRLVFELEERPYLAEVKFQGSKLLSHERILQLLADRKIILRMSAPWTALSFGVLHACKPSDGKD
jgi:outer membrane protein assembly factor BamA